MIVLATVLTTLWVYFLWSRRKYYAFSLKMPGPIGLPLIGIAHKIYNVANTLYAFPAIAAQYKTKSYFSWLGPYPFIYTIEPKLVETVLNNSDCINKAVVYDAMNDVLGDGILTSKSPRWNKHRKLLNPTFSYQVILSFIPNFNKICEELCMNLDENYDGAEVDMIEILMNLGLKTSITTTMGLDMEKESKKEFFRCFEILFVLTTERVLKPWLMSPIVYNFTSMYKQLVQARETVMGFVRKLVMNKIEAMKHQDENNNNSIDNSTEKQSVDIKKANNIFMEKVIRIKEKNEITLHDVIVESNVIIFAASETTATTLLSAFILLAMHPEYQEKVYEEIMTVFPDDEFQVKYEDFQNLVYLNMCINETLRFAPAVPLIGREVSKDLSLWNGIVIPKGTQIVIDIFNIQRDEDVWGPDAKTFNPDHFLPENIAGKPKCSFLPFSKGQRNCLGWQYAGMLMKVAMVHILRKYRFTTPFPFKDIRYMEGLTLKYEKLPPLQIYRRNGSK